MGQVRQGLKSLSLHAVWGGGLLGGLLLVLSGCPGKQVKVDKPPPARRVAKALPTVQIPAPFRKRYRFPAHVPLAAARGPRYAPLQIVELHNPLSPISRSLQALRKAVWRQFPGAVRWTIRMNPRVGKDRGYYYARALTAANRLGIFWPYLERFHQSKGRRSFAQLKAMATKSGVDPQLFELKLLYEPFKMLVERDMRFAARFGKLGKSVLFVNGALLPRPYTVDAVMASLKYAQTEASTWLRSGTTLRALYQAVTAKGRPLGVPPRISPAISARRYIHIPHAYLEAIPVRGPGDAAVHIVEFSDFTCRPCRKAYFWLHDVLKKYPKKMRFSFKFYPIGIHKESYRSSELAAAAQDRRKFWPLYDIMFREQQRVFQGELLALAKKAGINTQWIAGELDRRSYRRRVAINHAHGRRLGIRAVPTLLINGLKVAGIGSSNRLMKLVHQEMWKSGSPIASYP